MSALRLVRPPTLFDAMVCLAEAGECWSFQWAGQPLTRCDGCGLAYWLHTHYETYHKVNGETRWLNAIITRADAEHARRVWCNRD